MRWFVARLTAQTRDDRGVALFAAIAGMVLLSTMIAALVILARNENMIAQLNKDEAQAAYAAEAIYTATNRRTVIEEGQPGRPDAVRRQCLKGTGQRSDAGRCQHGGSQCLRTPRYGATTPCGTDVHGSVQPAAATTGV